MTRVTGEGDHCLAAGIDVAEQNIAGGVSRFGTAVPSVEDSVKIGLDGSKRERSSRKDDTDDLLARRVGRRSTEKTSIAQKAIELIRPGRTIFIDSGSTTTALAAAMEDMDLLVFTNSLTVASELSRLERTKTFVIGGRLNRYSKSTIGARAVEAVRQLTFDQVFLGVTGYQRGEGFSCGSDDEAVFKSTLVDRTHKCVVLMDSSKESRPSTFRVCDLSSVSIVVSDGGLSPDFSAACEDAGVTLL
jgi:DeoR family transcriptional regulator of aga operon